ncbi:MAG: hypothetical protein WDN03_19290 [Rhizomicrobium sp.]
MAGELARMEVLASETFKTPAATAGVPASASAAPAKRTDLNLIVFFPHLP